MLKLLTKDINSLILVSFFTGVIYMKRLLLNIITIMLIITNGAFAKPIFMTYAYFRAEDLLERTKLGNVYDTIGVFDPLASPTIAIWVKDSDELWDVETGILTGINDTEDPNVKLLTFMFQARDGSNYHLRVHDYSDIGIENLEVSNISYMTSEAGKLKGPENIEGNYPITRYDGEIPEEEIEKMFFK